MILMYIFHFIGIHHIDVTNGQPIGGIKHDIVKFIAHNKYNEDTFSHDIAIIQVTPFFNFSNSNVAIAAELNLDLDLKPSNHILLN